MRAENPYQRQKKKEKKKKKMKGRNKTSSGYHRAKVHLSHKSKGSLILQSTPKAGWGTEGQEA